MPHEIDLVLDDYHLVDGPDVEAGMAFLLEHLAAARAPGDQHPSRPGTAAGPAARARRAGRGPRRRPALHRRTRSTAYLNEVIGLDLAASDIAALEGRTEGWIAALQLAALSMQGRADVAGFIAGFAGDDRYIVDYLVEEVLARPARPGPQLPGPDLDPGPAERPAVRRRHRAARRQGHARVAGPRQPVRGPARRPAAGGTATTTSSPTSCGRTCSTSAPSEVARPAPPRQPVVRPER